MLFSKRKVTVIPGDGIGPEVVAAALKVVEASGVDIEPEICLAGAEALSKGIDSGVRGRYVHHACSSRRRSLLGEGHVEL